MMQWLMQKIVGSRNERVLKRLQKKVDLINAFEPAITALSDEAVRAKTTEFKARLEKGETLDDLLPEAFAVVREASRRALSMRHFDVQLIGGMVLHEGCIAEMRTGEGKTLMATLAAYLNALPGRGVHIVTVNDYLAKRDTQWMRPVYEFLGLTVGTIVANLSPQERRTAYNSDITYGTNNEFGFDYLRDNMAFRLEDKSQRDLNFAIVDEVDSILIDEARTPLIISGQAENSSELYQRMNQLVPLLKRQFKEEEPGDFTVDEKARQVYLTEQGHQQVETILEKWGLIKAGDSLYSAQNITYMHHVNAALRANLLYQRDVDYIVKNNQVVIVDEHTGRTMEGRRWSDGLHQAVEAKENVAIQHENQTLASISFQNYFRLYNRLSGMTGTADTEAYEFQQIYGLEVVVIPTHKNMIRQDMADKIFLTAKEKFDAIIKDIQACREKKQPVLVGTASIEVSEFLSGLLKQLKIPHQVLNAKFHEKEAHIIAQAGYPGTVTIATNMAGRGTDIMLGGNKKAKLESQENVTEAIAAAIEKEWVENHGTVLNAGGLRIIGTERHESRRIDNQLRGRSGRQGDPGSSQFYLSLEDNLLRIFAGDRMSSMMSRLGLRNGESIEHPWVSKAIENAQRKVEARNFDIRKQLLEYDNIANDQRKVIYHQRNELMQSENIAEPIQNIQNEVIDRVFHRYIPEHSLEEMWDVPGLEGELKTAFNIHLPVHEWLEKEEDLHEETLKQRLIEAFKKHFHDKESVIGAPSMRQFEKAVMLQSLDAHWREHLANMDHLRQGIHLRGYAQRDPKQEYQKEAFSLFTSMLDNIKYDVISILSRVEIQAPEEVQAVEAERQKQIENQKMVFEHSAFNENEETPDFNGGKVIPLRRETAKVGRNDACPCGSGKKYKHCHGSLDA